MYQIRSERLQLIAMTQELATSERLQQLGSLLGVKMPEVWPPKHVEGVSAIFEQVLEIRPESVGFLGWYWVDYTQDTPILIGFGGFKGMVDKAGWLEIGYAVVDGFHGRGYATEAVGMLTRWSMQFENVRGIKAHVQPQNIASRRVLKHNRYAYKSTIYNDAERRDEMVYVRHFELIL